MVAADIPMDEVIEELQPVLHGYLVEGGMPRDVASTVRLRWDGQSFSLTSERDLTQYEYGDGLGPAPRPIHKATNRLMADLEKAVTERLLADAATTVSPW